ncbi:sensor histidine kinase [Streptomyces olivaceus]|uniref:sensor histidine kinase n=1 Tax=Streptomyces olivaceus TaxID=47716 RepID=UPI001CD03D95|nr:histidine kinase [Streptomyces olivaceus]MBZ6192174.1 sensor histidine kinase [Streptomyces olivaceus]MBZ6205920.1 sensor histidine kinase [Streptomyces olivaceus]MBZ6282619.1 sensor histidine kinase [Streptomyces olivaceus]MBZ6305019.1 sensor histidine kinase [Streptomyces olivaceus]MBZ6317717.1 sensor histidine kinase [Streptomyces olivaceus]
MSTLWQRRVASRRTTEALTLTLLFAIALSGCFLSFGVMPGRPPMWAGVALSALACAALAWRRRWPFWVLAVTTLCVVTVSALGHLVTAMLMSPLMVAQYSVSLRARRRAGWCAALVATAALVASGLFHDELRDQWLIGLVNPAAWVPLSAAFGSYVRVRREYAAARAEHIAREREEEARHRVVQDRMRIARELHDVVAHHLTLAHAQAGVATHLARTDPEQAYEIMDRLSDTTAAALRELKSTVGLLRQDTDADDELAPAPGLARLPDLVAACAAADVTVTVSTEGEPGPLAPGLDLTAYRIVQEALTNVTKHAGPASAEVRLAHGARFLTLTVTNGTAAGSRPAPPPGPGFGLLGMRERALAAGGTFHAGPLPGGGFEVVCALPLHGPLPGHDESAAP